MLWFVVVLAGVKIAHQMGVFQDPSKLPEYQSRPDQCRVLPGTESLSFEDFRFVSENVILLSSGEVLKFYADGFNSVQKGALYAVDLKSEELQRLDLGLPSNSDFLPHGLNVAGNEVLVVNHAAKEDRIEHFLLHRDNSSKTIRLQWTKSRSLLGMIPHASANSVTRAGEDVYITTWLGGNGGLPNGAEHPPTTWLGIQFKLVFVWNYLITPAFPGLRTVWPTFVLRCRDHEDQCTVAASGFGSSNGITSSMDGKLVFVIDFPVRQLVVFDRDASTGALTKRTSHVLPSYADNIMLAKQVGGKYELHMGVVVDFATYIVRLVTKNEHPPAANGLLVVEFDPITNQFTHKHKFVHDGSLLHSSSAATIWGGNRVLLSSPALHSGLLICETQYNV
ncbi:hypothetical protein BASA81_006895 [Batrachochytrium salamandrivorans]|nr:hypothetical protein BASA81_006895 [Batrachochytrium salamandrivorans]